MPYTVAAVIDAGSNVRVTVPLAVAAADRVREVFDALAETVVPGSIPVPVTGSPTFTSIKLAVVVTVVLPFVVVQVATVKLGGSCPDRVTGMKKLSSLELSTSVGVPTANDALTALVVVVFGRVSSNTTAMFLSCD